MSIVFQIERLSTARKIVEFTALDGIANSFFS
jgi:hypothetical protein